MHDMILDTKSMCSKYLKLIMLKVVSNIIKGIYSRIFLNSKSNVFKIFNLFTILYLCNKAV